MTIDSSPTKTILLGVMFTNLGIYLTGSPPTVENGMLNIQGHHMWIPDVHVQVE